MEIYLYNKGKFLGQISSDCLPNKGDEFSFDDKDYIVEKKNFNTNTSTNKVIGCSIHLISVDD